MVCCSVRIALLAGCAAWIASSESPGKKATVELTHMGKASVVTGKAKKERADLDAVQKFFPKVTTGDSDEEFVDDVAGSLDDAQADLLVGDQKPSKVCARDIKKFCGAGEMKKKHPLHCLGLLKDEAKSQIHKLCRVHVENSLTFTCAQDIDKFDCDPVMRSTIDCLSDSMQQLDEDCADQVRLVHTVVSKVNSAEVTVSDQNETHSITSTGGGEIDPNWHCPRDDFESHYDQVGCCEFKPENEDVCKENKFSCVKQKCKAGSGRWILRLEAGAPLAGHLCCGPTKPTRKEANPLTGILGILEQEGIIDQTDDGQVELTSGTRRDLIFFFFLVAAVSWWKWDTVRPFLMALKAQIMGEVNVPGLPAIELTTFFKGLVKAPKEVRSEMEKATPAWAKKTNSSYGSYGL